MPSTVRTSLIVLAILVPVAAFAVADHAPGWTYALLGLAAGMAIVLLADLLTGRRSS